MEADGGFVGDAGFSEWEGMAADGASWKLAVRPAGSPRYSTLVDPQPQFRRETWARLLRKV